MIREQMSNQAIPTLQTNLASQQKNPEKQNSLKTQVKRLLNV